MSRRAHQCGRKGENAIRSVSLLRPMIEPFKPALRRRALAARVLTAARRSRAGVAGPAEAGTLGRALAGEHAAQRDPVRLADAM